MIPVENYLGSFGDNYCIGCNNPGVTFPTETPYTVWPPVAGQPRCGWPGEQGTLLDNFNCSNSGTAPGTLRGMFDVTTNQTVRLASVTDGTSNTLAVGEGLPAQRADNNVWEWNSGADGTTVPINYPSNQSCALPGNDWGTTNWASRCAYTNTGFKSHHPGGCNFAVRRRIRPLPQADDQHVHVLRTRQPQRWRGRQFRSILIEPGSPVCWLAT